MLVAPQLPRKHLPPELPRARWAEAAVLDMVEGARVVAARRAGIVAVQAPSRSALDRHAQLVGFELFYVMWPDGALAFVYGQKGRSLASILMGSYPAARAGMESVQLRSCVDGSAQAERHHG